MFPASQGTSWLGAEASINGGEIAEGTSGLIKRFNKLVRTSSARDVQGHYGLPPQWSMTYL